MTAAVTSNGRSLTLADYCDFGSCAANCWGRCGATMDRWDGAPTIAWREAWRVTQKRRPKQRELFG